MKKKTAKQIIKSNLLILGDKIVEDASKNSRVAKDRYRKRDDKWGKQGELIKAGGTLRDSVNKRVIGSETLVVFHRYYGAYQKPNELLESVNRFTKEQTKVIIKEINEMILNKTKK
jgi:hypothetical protein